MFGYIRPLVPELRVKENEFYKALYCGICKDLGKTVGRSARLTLSYDAVFLSLLLAQLSGERFSLRSGRCLLHPTKKRQIVEDCASVRAACAVGTVLSYYKLADDRCDERGIRKWMAKWLTPHGARLCRKAEGLLPKRPDLQPRFAALAAAERCPDSSPDQIAAQMGEIVGELFSCCIAEEFASELLREIGYHIGKWVYFADAADDYEEDCRKGRFNPFRKDGLDRSALAAAMEAELLPIDRLLGAVRVTDAGVDALLRNILHDGMYAVQQRLETANEQDSENNKKKKKRV